MPLAARRAQKGNADLHAEVDKLEEEVLRGLLGPRRAAQQPAHDGDRGGACRRTVRPRARGKGHGCWSSSPMPTRRRSPRREAIEKLKADLKAIEEEPAPAQGGHAESRHARQSREGFRRHRRSPVPERPQARRRAHRDPGRRVGQHARRNRRQRDPAAQHAGIASPAVDEVASHGGDRRLAHDADSRRSQSSR